MRIREYHPRAFLIVALLASGFGVGCSVVPDFHTPEVPLPENFHAPKESQPGPELETWWKSFQDPTLEKLLAEAVQENLDLKLAETRIRTARAQLSVANAGLLPSPVIDGSANRSKASKNIALGGNQAATTTGGSSGGTNGGTTGTPTGGANNIQLPPGATANLFRAGFDATWELDIFGGVRAEIEVAANLYEAQIEARNSALVTLLAEVARNYIELRGFQHQKEIVQKNIQTQADSLEIQTTRLQAGISSELAVAQAESQLASTKSEIPNLETSIEKSLHRISILLGKPPQAVEAELAAAQPIPSGPRAITPGLPSDLLRRRPDIRAAERRLEAANAQVGVAISDLFPKFNLTSSLGLQSRRTSIFADSSSLFWSIGSTVSWSILSWHAIEANIELQSSREEESLIQYQQTVLSALEEVDNALVAYEQEQKRHQLLEDAVRSTRRSLDLAVKLNDAGVVEFINVLQAEQSVSEAERQLSVSDQLVSTNLLAIYKALGGGWERGLEIGEKNTEPKLG